MKNLFCILLIISLYRVSYGQFAQIDELKRQLAIAKQDSSRVLLLSLICYRYRFSNPDSGVVFGEQALKLARKINYTYGEATALNRLGSLVREKGNLPKALSEQFDALRLAETHHFLDVKGECLNSIGNIYQDLSGYPIAINYYKVAQNVFENIGDNTNTIRSIGNMASAYMRMNQLDSALFFAQRAYQKTDAGNIEYKSTVGRTMGDIYTRLGKYTLALLYFRRSIKQVLQINDSYRTHSQIYNSFAQLYRKINQPDSCIYYAQKALDEGKKASYRVGILTASTLLTEAYKSKNNLQQAFHYQELMVAAKDSLYGAGNIQAIQQMIANEQERQKELDNQKVIYQNQLKQYALLAGLAIFFMITFILYRYNNQQKKANTLLHRQKEEIDRQRGKAEQALTELKSTQTQLIQREKMASLGELTAGIAHEIQNPLNFVNNFSELSTELVEELKSPLTPEGGIPEGKKMDMELFDDLTQNLQKIVHHGQRASSIVKGMLEHSRTSSGQKEPTDINTLADEYLRLAYQGFLRSGVPAKNQPVTCELITDFTPSLPLVDVVPQEIGRVLLNLFNNAFYAVNEQGAGGKGQGMAYKPAVWVSTKRGEQTVEIRVRDNGTGIPDSVKAKIFQPFFTTKPTGEGTGLGLSLSYDIVTKGHGGTLTVNTEAGAFTEFIITLSHQTQL